MWPRIAYEGRFVALLRHTSCAAQAVWLEAESPIPLLALQMLSGGCLVVRSRGLGMIVSCGVWTAYWMMGFINDVGKFFWFMFIIFLTLNLMGFYGAH